MYVSRQIGRVDEINGVYEEARETEAGKGNANGRTMIVRNRCACDFLGLNRANIPKMKYKDLNKTDRQRRNEYKRHFVVMTL